MRRLGAELDKRGWRYIQDITLNHSNPLDTHALGRLYSGADGQQILISSYDDDVDPATGTRFYKHYQDTPQCQQAAMESDEDWTDWQLHHCLLADLSGYDQRNPTIADYLIRAGEAWLDAGVADFRLDAVKFPFPDFIAGYTQSVIEHQRSNGRDDPYIVGEWSGGGVGDAKSLAFANAYGTYHTNILDFALSLALNQFVGGAYEASSQELNAAGLDRLLHQRVGAFDGRDTWQGTFINNHDQMRTLVRLQKLGVPSETERRRRLDLATVLLLTVRGIPIVFYGDEQYVAHYDDGHDTPPEDVNSDNDDPFNRIGMRAWDEATPAFRITRALARLRARSAAIWKGSYRTVYAKGDVLVFERRSGRETVLVAVNRGQARTLDLPTGVGLRAGVYRGVLRNTGEPNASSRLTVRPDGSATLRLARLGALVVE